MICPSPYSSRNQFGQLLNDRQLLGEAVEIGTHQADFAQVFLDVWQGEKLYCVDPWSVPDGYESQVEQLWSSSSRSADKRIAISRLEKFGERAELIEDLSIPASQRFHDAQLDFVYIDGDHRCEEVKKDISAWSPKVREGGIIAGHDFICPGEEPENWGRPIQRALSETLAVSRDVFVIVEENGLPWSWYVVN